MFSALWADENGQDVAEFTLLVAFVTLVSAALYMLSAENVAGCWAGAQNRLDRAESIARNGS